MYVEVSAMPKTMVIIDNQVVNGVIWRVAVMAASIASLRCSADDRSPNDVDATKVASLTRQTVHATDEAGVLVRVEPNATCTVRGEGFDNFAVYADARGVARFSVYSDTVGAAFELSLICTDRARSAQPLLYPIQVTVVPDAEALQAPTASLDDLPFPGRWIGPLTEDPETVTAARLTELHLPAKPDRLKAPGQYAAWLEQVSRPMLEIEPVTAESDLRNTIGDDTHPIWAGYVTYGYETIPPDKRFDIVSGQWAVPGLSGPPVGTGAFFSSTWVGLGGFNNAFQAGLPQTGTAQNLNCTYNQFFNRVLCLSNYYGWMEYFPDVEHPVSNFPVSRGDVIQASVTMVNGIGQFDPFGTNALMRLTNTTRSITTFTTWSLPAGNTFFADSAEWIVERPLRNNAPTSLANFGTITLNNTQANVTGPDFSQHTIMYGDSPADTAALTMVNATKVLATPSPGSGSLPAGQAMTVHWVASH
jgi:hypothetical protein